MTRTDGSSIQKTQVIDGKVTQVLPEEHGNASLIQPLGALRDKYIAATLNRTSVVLRGIQSLFLDRQFAGSAHVVYVDKKDGRFVYSF